MALIQNASLAGFNLASTVTHQGRLLVSDFTGTAIYQLNVDPVSEGNSTLTSVCTLGWGLTSDRVVLFVDPDTDILYAITKMNLYQFTWNGSYYTVALIKAHNTGSVITFCYCAENMVMYGITSFPIGIFAIDLLNVNSLSNIVASNVSGFDGTGTTTISGITYKNGYFYASTGKGQVIRYYIFTSGGFRVISDYTTYFNIKVIPAPYTFDPNTIDMKFSNIVDLFDDGALYLTYDSHDLTTTATKPGIFKVIDSNNSGYLDKVIDVSFNLVGSTAGVQTSFAGIGLYNSNTIIRETNRTLALGINQLVYAYGQKVKPLIFELTKADNVITAKLLTQFNVSYVMTPPSILNSLYGSLNLVNGKIYCSIYNVSVAKTFVFRYDDLSVPKIDNVSSTVYGSIGSTVTFSGTLTNTNNLAGVRVDLYRNADIIKTVGIYNTTTAFSTVYTLIDATDYTSEFTFRCTTAEDDILNVSDVITVSTPIVTTPYGSVGAFYFGNETITNVTSNYTVPNLDFSVKSFFIDYLATYDVPTLDFSVDTVYSTFDSYTLNSFDFDFVAIPVAGSSPLQVVLSAFNYTPKDQYGQAWYADSIDWYYDYINQPALSSNTKVTDLYSTTTNYTYTGVYGKKFSVKVCVNYKLK